MAKSQLSGPLTRQVEKGEMICVAGEKNSDLYIIHSAKLLVFVNDKTKITPLAQLGDGEYLGELSFFDRKPRSAHVICTEPGTLIQIPVTEIDKQFPSWLVTMALSITQKLRKSSELIRQKGIRRKNVETIKPLSIEAQRDYYQKLLDYLEENPHIKEEYDQFELERSSD